MNGICLKCKTTLELDATMCIRCGTVIYQENEDTQELSEKKEIRKEMSMNYHKVYLLLSPILTFPAMMFCVTLPQIIFISMFGIVPSQTMSNILSYSIALAINAYIIWALYVRKRIGYLFTKILHIVQLIISPILILAAFVTTMWGPIMIFFPIFSLFTLTYYSKRKYMFK